MKKQAVTVANGPSAIGPYSVGIQAGEFVFTAGQIGLDPATGNIVSGGVEAETRQALENLKKILEAAHSGLDQVVKTTVFLQNMGDFAAMAYWMIGVALILKPLTFYFFGLYRRMWSYASVQELKLVFFAVTASSVLVSTVMKLRGRQEE